MQMVSVPTSWQVQNFHIAILRKASSFPRHPVPVRISTSGLDGAVVWLSIRQLRASFQHHLRQGELHPKYLFDGKTSQVDEEEEVQTKRTKQNSKTSLYRSWKEHITWVRRVCCPFLPLSGCMSEAKAQEREDPWAFRHRQMCQLHTTLQIPVTFKVMLVHGLKQKNHVLFHPNF